MLYHKNIWLCMGLWCITQVLLPASAQTIYVTTGGSSHTAPYDTWAKAATSLNIAVEFANNNYDGALVLVADGKYILTNEVIVSNTQVRGWSGNRDAVTIDGGNYAGRETTNRCFALLHSNASLVGLTITNGWGTNNFGGGVRIFADGATISNCVVAFNRADRGGGVYASAAGIIKNCLFATNWLTANHYGAGIHLILSTTTPTAIVANCTFIGNRYGEAGTGYQGGSGGGGYFRGRILVTNCTFEANRAYSGGGIMLENYVLVADCILRNNIASLNGGGIYLMTGQAGNTIVRNCLIAGNSPSGGIIDFGSTWRPNAYIEYTRIISNNAIGVVCPSNVFLKNCLIAGNTNGGVKIKAAFGNGNFIESCTIAGNTGGQGAGLLAEGTNVNGAVLNTIISGNTNTNAPGIDDDIYAPTAGASNMFAYCLANYAEFPSAAGNRTGSPYFLNLNAGDFRLGSGSPAIDAGLNQVWMTNAVDLDSRPRIFHGRVDMGAYEHRFTGCFIQVY